MSTSTEAQKRLQRFPSTQQEFQFAIVTDEDQAAQIELENGQTAWSSTIRYDKLVRKENPKTGKPEYQFHYDIEDNSNAHQLISIISQGQRGAEFSELCNFGRHLLTMDDKTGLICEIRQDRQLVPRHILMTGSGDEKFKGFKSEWATLKGNELIIGSHGRVEFENGKAKPGELEWIKVLDKNYQLKSVDWHSVYEKMRRALNIDSDQGYITHEAAEWHPEHEKWYFFPRKISYEAFDEAKDEKEKGTNTLIIADENFENIETMEIGDRHPERGVSSFKIVPGHPNECIGLKSVEVGNTTETYIFAFDFDGNILSEEQFYGPYKCEGVEFI